MGLLVYEDPEGAEHENPPLERLRGYITSPPWNYWHRGSGAGALRFQPPGKDARQLLISPDGNGFWYLKFLDTGRNEWMPVHDRSRLAEVREALDGWKASAGMFLPSDFAWHVIEHFCRTGERSPEVQWITPAEIPEGGSY